MTMEEKIAQLRATLSELHEELKDIDQLDDQTREMLTNTANELDEVLGEEASEQRQTLSQQLSDVAQEFEDSHPQLTRLLGSIVDALAQLGI
jgi:ABC-type transporter Mla subunit MlaD